MTSQFTKLFSFILANVHDPALPDDAALRLPCYSCMSPYLEEHYQYLSHLYRRPLSFTRHCDMTLFDQEYLFMKNCTDVCVTLRVSDVIGGRRRHGYMRGCLSDIIGYNQTVVRQIGDRRGGCIETTARELFLITGGRQELEPSRIALCGCTQPGCNPASSIFSSIALLLLIFLLVYRQ